MKRFFAIVLSSSLFLAACSSNEELAGLSPEVMDANPEIKDLSVVWDKLTYAAQNEDCEEFLSYTLSTSSISEEDCKAAGRVLAEEIPVIDWENSEFNGDRSRVELHQVDGGELAFFILEEGKWVLENNFWEKL